MPNIAGHPPIGNDRNEEYRIEIALGISPEFDKSTGRWSIPRAGQVMTEMSN